MSLNGNTGSFGGQFQGFLIDSIIIVNTSYMMYYIYMEIYDYVTAGGKNVILNYIDKLSDGLKAEAYTIRQNISQDGLSAFDFLTTRQLQGKLYEIKFSNQRIMYVIKDADAVYFLHMCKK